jgi:hypothetical protein
MPAADNGGILEIHSQLWNRTNIIPQLAAKQGNIMAVQPVPTAARYDGTSAPFDHALSAQLDLLIVQLEHESSAVLKLCKRIIERHLPASHAGQGGRHE